MYPKDFIYVSPIECKTIGGGNPPIRNALCVFPFKHDGYTFEGCTTYGYDSAWCATEVDSEGEMIKGKWGICRPGCPVKSRDCLKYLVLIYERIGITN